MRKVGGSFHTYSRESKWCYSPAFPCHQSILRNAQSDFTAVKFDPYAASLLGKGAIMFLHKLQEMAGGINYCSLSEMFTSCYMYHILSIKILCDDKVVSPVIDLLHSAIKMCTVGLRSAPSPSDSVPREVVQLDATIGAVQSEHSSIHLSEPVGKVSLRAFRGDETEIRQYCLVLSECTVLNFQGHRLCEFTGCFDPHDRAEEV